MGIAITATLVQIAITSALVGNESPLPPLPPPLLPLHSHSSSTPSQRFPPLSTLRVHGTPPPTVLQGRPILQLPGEVVSRPCCGGGGTQVPRRALALVTRILASTPHHYSEPHHLATPSPALPSFHPLYPRPPLPSPSSVSPPNPHPVLDSMRTYKTGLLVLIPKALAQCKAKSLSLPSRHFTIKAQSQHPAAALAQPGLLIAPSPPVSTPGLGRDCWLCSSIST